MIYRYAWEKLQIQFYITVMHIKKFGLGLNITDSYQYKYILFLPTAFSVGTLKWEKKNPEKDYRQL